MKFPSGVAAKLLCPKCSIRLEGFLACWGFSTGNIQYQSITIKQRTHLFGAKFGTFTMCLERCKKLQRQCVVKGNYQIALTCWHNRIRNSRLIQWIYCKYIEPGLLILAPRIKSIQNLQRYQNCKPPNHIRHAHHPTNSSTSNFPDIPGWCYTLPWLRFPSRQLLSSTTGFSFQAKPSCWSHWSESCRIDCGCIFRMIIPDLQDHTSPSVWNVPFLVGSVISSTSQHLLKLIETCWNILKLCLITRNSERQLRHYAAMRYALPHAFPVGHTEGPTRRWRSGQNVE